MASGTKLPSTGELSKRWNTSNFTIHTALKNLVKEGMLERRHGRGTFVCERPDRLTRVGIYQGNPDIWVREDMGFYRQVHCNLEKQLAAIGATARVFFDRRDPEKQDTVLPELAAAVRNKEIQGLIIPLASGVNLPPIISLPLPISVITGAVGIQNKIVSLDAKAFFRELLTRLSRKGCRKVGLITSSPKEFGTPLKSGFLDFDRIFRLEAESHGMETKDAWVVYPETKVDNPMKLGYQEFMRMWGRKQKPDALIAHPDVLVPGVISAALQLGLHHGNEVQFCFHRNKHFQSVCPFPAIWAITDEELIAEKLVELIQTQFRGGTVSPVHVPDTFVELQSSGVE